MSNTAKWTTRLLIAIVAFALCGLPQVLEAQSAPSPQQPAADQQPPPAPPPNTGIVDPAKGPLQPVPAAPDTGNATSEPQPPEPPSAPAANTPPRQQQPLGTAVGETGVTTGGPASRPAGSAIAPAKQRQTRSLLIKIGAAAAAAAAIGTVVALSKGSPSNPPGAK